MTPPQAQARHSLICDGLQVHPLLCAPNARRMRWTKPSIAPYEHDGQRLVEVTHPFHPLFGRRFASSTAAATGVRTGSTSTTSRVRCARCRRAGPTTPRSTRSWWWPRAGARSGSPTCSIWLIFSSGQTHPSPGPPRQECKPDYALSDRQITPPSQGLPTGGAPMLVALRWLLPVRILCAACRHSIPTTC